MTGYSLVRGMRDLLPAEARTLRYIQNKAREIAQLYGYREVITPVVESYELLAAKTGEEVKSRMYVFEDLGGRKVALRPEFTASVARLVATSLRTEPKPLRLLCIGSLYRYDEPQRGRFREFWQSNFELMGSDKPEADAEILLLTNSLMRTVGLQSYSFKVGHVGILKGILNQENIEENLQSRILQLMDKKLHEDALRLLKESGASEKCIQVFRELVSIRGADPASVISEIQGKIKGYSEALKAAENLAEILRLLEKAQRLEITLDAGFARGLEYYTGMIFEVYVPELDIAIAGGGRYDRLVELFGGEATPAVGVAHGLDRIMLAMQEQHIQIMESDRPSAIILPLREELKGEALRIAEQLRAVKVPVELEVMGRKTSKALEDADRRGIAYAILVGERELKEDEVILKDMRRHEQKTVKIGELASLLLNHV